MNYGQKADAILSGTIYEKLSLLQDTYGAEEVLSLFVEYLEDQDYDTLRLIVNDGIKDAMSNGDIEL